MRTGMILIFDGLEDVNFLATRLEIGGGQILRDFRANQRRLSHAIKFGRMNNLWHEQQI